MLEVDDDSRLGQEMLLGGVRYGAADTPGDDAIAEFYEMAVERLAALGIPRYEISNFARPGRESRHNLKYWTLEPYVGFGADAHSFDGRARWQNPETVEEYLAQPRAAPGPCPPAPATSASSSASASPPASARRPTNGSASPRPSESLRSTACSNPTTAPSAPHQPRRAALQRSLPGVSRLMIDLRSDTVTRPTPAMRRAMVEAEVGDDVYGEDPTVNRLERRAAEIAGKEAALFVPTGTMGNTIAVKLLTEHGQEVICDSRAHMLDYELSMVAWFSGCVVRAIPTADGMLSWDEVSAPHPARQSLFRAHRPGGDREHPQHGRRHGLPHARRCAKSARARTSAACKVHMDGARIFNAAAAAGHCRCAKSPPPSTR